VKGWPDRLAEVGRHQATEFRWTQTWALIARSLRQHDLAHAEAQLWSLRFASWARSLLADSRTCRYCGGHIATDDARARYCSVSCRKATFRCRKEKRPTPLDELTARAARTLDELRSEASRGQRALRRWRDPVPPPDWTALDHVPSLPDPCTGGCPPADDRCTHTGAICLYARTRHAPED
jgi:hypothetical protein